MTDINFPEKLKFLFDPMRYKIAYGGRGSGKSHNFAVALLLLAAKKPLRILCTREVQRSIKQSVHLLLSDQIQNLGLGQFFQVLDQEIRGINGSLFIFAGLAQHTVESIKSMANIDVVWCEEAQVISKRSWDVLIPTIRKPESEIWISFNPELDTDETYTRFVLNPSDDTIVEKLNYGDNPYFPDVLERERLHCKNTQSKESYENIWEGKCKPAVEGAIYAHEIAKLKLEKRLCNAPYDSLLKVHTVWDLGWNDSMSIAMVQRSGSGEIRVIDYIEDSHRTLDSYVNELAAKGYRYGTDFIPHDGRSRDFKSGKSTEELLQAFGRNVTVLGRDDIEEGIKVARMMFGRVWIDTRASALLNQLARYRRTQNQSTGTFGAPLHDDSSHGADCFRYIAMAEQQMSNDDWTSGKLKYPTLNYG